MQLSILLILQSIFNANLNEIKATIEVFNNNQDSFVYMQDVSNEGKEFDEMRNEHAFLINDNLNYMDEKVFENKNYLNTKPVCSNQVCQDGIFKWHEKKTKNLYVGGIFPMVGSWSGGQSCLPSAIMALNEVNLNASILPNYRLNLNWFNSEV